MAPEEPGSTGATKDRDAAVEAVIGERLRARRIELGLSQEEVAALVGVVYQQIQRHESGAARLTVARLLTLAQALRLPAADLLAGLPDGAAPSATEEEGAAPPDTAPSRLSKAQLELAYGFGRLRDEEVRAALAGLVRAILDNRG